LRDEFAKDMIKPTKFTEGGSINSFQTEAQVNRATKEEKRPASGNQHPAARANSIGVKIDTAQIRLSDSFKCTAEEFYRVLTTPDLLQAFTQNMVTVDAVVGGHFSLLNGNIT